MSGNRPNAVPRLASRIRPIYYTDVCMCSSWSASGMMHGVDDARDGDGGGSRFPSTHRFFCASPALFLTLVAPPY